MLMASGWAGADSPDMNLLAGTNGRAGRSDVIEGFASPGSAGERQWEQEIVAKSTHVGLQAFNSPGSCVIGFGELGQDASFAELVGSARLS